MIQNKYYSFNLTLFRMGLFGAPPLLLAKFCQIYPTIMKLNTDIPYVKGIQKIAISPEIRNFCYIKK